MQAQVFLSMIGAFTRIRSILFHFSLLSLPLTLNLIVLLLIYTSCVSAVRTITLSPADTNSLRTLTHSTTFTLLPPLPRKIHTLATSYSPSLSPSFSSPSYLLCCVRLSPEKNVEVFVEVCSRLSSFLSQQNIIPYLLVKFILIFVFIYLIVLYIFMWSSTNKGICGKTKKKIERSAHTIYHC
jgi:hypothetical protein